MMYLSELQNGQAVKNEAANINFELECDVIVAGLGTAGALAAVSAAESGASVIGIERIKMCGGTATAGGVFGYYYGLPGGRFEEIDKVTYELGKENFVSEQRHPYAKSHAEECAIYNAGGKIMYETAVAGVYLEEDTVCGVKTVSAGEVINISCKVLIDCTGDGEVSAAAGAGFNLGRQIDGKPQPFSSIRVFVREDKGLGLANFDAGYVLPNDAEDLTRGLLAANALHRGGLENFGDGLLWVTLPPGPREGRLIECDERLYFRDFIHGKRSDMPITYAFSNFDSHTQDWAFESDQVKDWMVVASLWGFVFSFPLPKEIMFVKGFSNLLCAGRNVSIDHDMASAIRMQRALQKLGEAAGYIAALASRDNIGIRSVDHNEIAAAMKTSGALNEADGLKGDKFASDPDEMLQILASDAPGTAIWQAGNHLARYRKMLISNLDSENEHIARNSALALGLGEDPAAIPKLIEIVRSHDQFEPKSSRSHNQRRILGAIHLLGNLGGSEAITALLEFILTPELDLQEFSHTLIALMKLGDCNLNKRAEIAEALNVVLDDGCKEYKLLLKNSSSTGYRAFVDMTEFMQRIWQERLEQWSNV